jgi:hypothetical protein
MSEQKQPKDQIIPPPPRPGDVYVIPPEGSLGLLALGAVGLKAWREKRDAVGFWPEVAPPPEAQPPPEVAAQAEVAPQDEATMRQAGR